MSCKWCHKISECHDSEASFCSKQQQQNDLERECVPVSAQVKPSNETHFLRGGNVSGSDVTNGDNAFITFRFYINYTILKSNIALKTIIQPLCTLFFVTEEDNQ